jgi:ABC-type dipeptide/oligopeptide/nickel transport system permease subunit
MKKKYYTIKGSIESEHQIPAIVQTVIKFIIETGGITFKLLSIPVIIIAALKLSIFEEPVETIFIICGFLNLVWMTCIVDNDVFNFKTKRFVKDE